MLDVIDIVVKAFMPLVVVLVGWKLNERLKQIEHSNWANQKLVEKKLVLYDEMMPLFNTLYCFYMFVGDWKDISPYDVIKTKRELDRKVHIYEAILGPNFMRAYNEFIDIAFNTYTVIGGDARIKSIISGFDGDRKAHGHYDWRSGWDALFPYPQSFDKTKFTKGYEGIISAFRVSIGIIGDNSLSKR